MREVRSAFYCPDFYVADYQYDPGGSPELYADPEVNYVVYEYDPDKPNIYARYNVTNHSVETKYFDDVDINLKLYRIFTWHNFLKGTLWFRYSVVVTDKDGVRIFGGWDVPVKLTIEKANGKWEITKLYESP